MMSYIDLPVSGSVRPVRKVILGLGFVVAAWAVFFYFSGIAQALLVYINNNTYTKNSPDSGQYYEAFTDSFTPSISVNNVTFSYDVLPYNLGPAGGGCGGNVATVKVRVYINGVMVTDSIHGSLANNAWTAQTVNITNFWNAGTNYNLKVDFTRGTYCAGGYYIKLRNFAINDPTPPDTTPPTATYSTFGGHHFQNPPLSVGVTFSDPSGVTYTRHCSGTSTCDPGTANVSTFANGSTFFALEPLNTYTYLCIRARDGAGNWSTQYQCNAFNRRLAMPTNLSASANGNSVTLQWTDTSTEETGYRIYKSNNGGVNWSLIHTTGSKNGASSYNYTETVNGSYIYKVAAFVTGVDEVDSYNSNQITIADQIAPRVLSLNAVTPTRVAPEITFSASDTGGTGLASYQIWRTSDGEYPIGWTNVSGNINVSGNFINPSWTNNSATRGIWWYRVQVFDGAGNCINNLGSHECGGVQADSLDPRTPVPDVRVVLDNISPVTSVILPDPGTYACSTSNSTDVHIYANDTGSPDSPPVTIHYTTTTGLGGDTKTEASSTSPIAQAGLPGDNLGRVLQASTPTCASPQMPSAGVPVTQDNTTVNFVACDQADNQSSVVSGVYRCNLVPPNIAFTVSSPPLNGWTNGNVSVTVQAYDADRVASLRQCWTPDPSCVPSTSFGNCNGTTTTCSGTAIYNTDQGQIRICVRATDVPGNTSTVQCSWPYGRDTGIPNNPTVTGPTNTNNKTPSVNVAGTDSLSGVGSFTADFYDDVGGVWTYCTSQTTSTNPGTLTMPIACYNGTYGGSGGVEFEVLKKINHPLAWLKNIFLPGAQAQAPAGGDGLYRFAVRARDLAGNYSNFVNHYVEIDTTPPPPPTINPFGEATPAFEHTINLSNVQSLRIDGTCTGQAVLFYVNGVWTRSYLCSDGSWGGSMDYSYLPDGYVIIGAYDVDAAGNYSTAFELGLKDTVRPTVPQSVMCPYNPTNTNLYMTWGQSTDISGISSYSLQPYSCSNESCMYPTPLDPIGTVRTSVNLSQTDGYYTFDVRAIDNANNESFVSARAVSCMIDLTPPNPTTFVPCGLGSQTTCSPTNISTPTVQFVTGTDPVVNGASSGGYCNNVYPVGPQGQCDGGVCLAPESTTYTLPAGCYTGTVIGQANETPRTSWLASLWRNIIDFVLAAPSPAPQSGGGDGVYTFVFDTTDGAGNISKVSMHSVEIDKTPPSVGNDLVVIADDRKDEFPNLLGRNYTATPLDPVQSKWQTNSNWPKLTIGCMSDCQFVQSNPDNTMIRWQREYGLPFFETCTEIARIFFPNMYCSTECGAPDPYAACFNVHFDPNMGAGHNGVLIVPLANVFRDAAGNPATGTAELTIENQAPTIIVK